MLKQIFSGNHVGQVVPRCIIIFTGISLLPIRMILKLIEERVPKTMMPKFPALPIDRMRVESEKQRLQACDNQQNCKAPHASDKPSVTSEFCYGHKKAN